MWMEARAMRNTILRSGYGLQQALSTDFARLEQKVALSLGAITEKMDLFRREMLAEIRAASK